MLSVLAVCLYYLIERNVNFDGVNSTPAIRNQMPWHYHERFLMLCAFMICISLSSFIASHYETPLIFSLSSLLSLVAMVGCILMLTVTHQTAVSVDGEITGGKCPFILP
jgi:hypothetical protein